jgi:hypothetical protein
MTTYPMIKMVVIDGIRYKPADAERVRANKAMSPNQPIGIAFEDIVEDHTTTSAAPQVSVEEPEADDSAVVTQPNRGASKALWVEYAVSQGAEAEVVEAMSRDSIADTYGE